MLYQRKHISAIVIGYASQRLEYLSRYGFSQLETLKSQCRAGRHDIYADVTQYMQATNFKRLYF